MRYGSRLAVDGLRSLALLKPREYAFAAPLSAHLMVYLAYLVTLAGFETVSTESPRIFEATGIATTIAAIAVTLALLCLLPFRRNGTAPERVMLGAATAGTAMLALLTVATALAKWFAGAQFGDAELGGTVTLFVAFFCLVVWGALVAFRLIYGMANRRRAALALGGSAVLLIAPFMLPQNSIISGKNDTAFTFSLVQMAGDALRPARAAPSEKAANERPPVDGEAVMMRQHALVATAVAGLAPARAEQPELYFVGFAPYSWEDVFKREVTAVKTLFDDRFGTAGRSIVLQNHRDSIADLPLASISNLETVLAQIGQRMQRDRDVLVLFVTSHGNEKVISVSMEGVRLNNLTPARLTKALDQAGIQNRVLILSACYSGSFVPPLSDENTMILTASRADRTSFGCSNEREWTFFGDAFFNHALREERSFVAAYARARDLIGTWEKEQGLVASEPQIFVGDAIRGKIDSILAARLAD